MWVGGGKAKAINGAYLCAPLFLEVALWQHDGLQQAGMAARQHGLDLEGGNVHLLAVRRTHLVRLAETAATDTKAQLSAPYHGKDAYTPDSSSKS